MKLILISPNGLSEEFEAQHIQVKTGIGDMGLEDNHTASMVVLKDGQIVIKTSDDTHQRYIKGGVLQCTPTSALILADSFATEGK